MWVYLVQGIGYGFAASVQPGPFQTWLISQTLSRGWKRALLAALAPLLSDGPIIALALLVLSRLPAWLERTLYIAGGLFILYLALSAVRAWQRYDAAAIIEAGPVQYNVLKAALMNALSPGPYLYWSLVTGPILLSGWHRAPINGIAFLVGFYATMVASLAILIIVIGTMRRLGPKVNRALLGLSALLLIGFGVYQLWLGLSMA
jgi:threonine/homoserine/homoserine lactone efflux protein